MSKDINERAQEFRANAEACKIEPTRALMNSYVTDGINADGTSKIDGSRTLSQKDAACMKVPGAVDNSPMSAKLGSWLDNNLADAKKFASSLVDDVKAIATSPAASQAVQDPKAAAQSASQAVQDAPGNLIKGVQEGFKVYANIGPK